MKFIKLSAANGRIIELSKSEVMAISWDYKKILKTKTLDDHDARRADKIISNRSRIKEPGPWSFLSEQEKAIYRHFLTDSERAEIDKAFEDHNQGKILESGKPNKNGVSKGKVSIPLIGRGVNASEISRYVPKIVNIELTGDILGDYLITKDYCGWELYHIKTGFSMLQTQSLRDYKVRSNSQSYSFKKAQVLEIAIWINQQNLIVADNYDDLVKRIKADRQEIIDNLVNVYAPLVDKVAFG